MTGSGDDRSEAMEAYVRGELHGAEREAFERAMMADPALRAEVELQRRIDERLRAMYVAPEPTALGMAGGRARPVRGWVGWALGMAAAVALTAAGVYSLGLLGPGPGGTPASAVLARLERNGFEPAWVCKDDAEFIDYTRKTFGRPFTVDPAPGVQVVGWDYCAGVLGDYAGVLMAQVGEDRVIVVVDKAAQDRKVVVDVASGLKVFRKRAGGVVLYEVTPRSEPAVLPLVRMD